jgi:hypothetical protein
MGEDTETTTDLTFEFDPAYQTEKIAFDPDQLVPCGSCGRMSPPTRFKCLYCAHELETNVSADEITRPVLRKLELWENGHNVILLSCSPDADLKRAAEVLAVDIDFITDIVASAPLPVARVESQREASFLISALEKHGFSCSHVPDEDLHPERLPVRLRGIEFAVGEIILVDFNTHDVISVETSKLLVAVAGRLISGRVDSTEKRGRKGRSKLIDETATNSDELVLDLYVHGDSIGYRINQAGFDFSGLGAEKSLLAAENMRRLAGKLKEYSPAVAVVDGYEALRYAIDPVWELESRKDPQGIRRTAHKIEFGMVASTNNLSQFTKFSRLQRHLYETKDS